MAKPTASTRPSRPPSKAALAASRARPGSAAEVAPPEDDDDDGDEAALPAGDAAGALPHKPGNPPEPVIGAADTAAEAVLQESDTSAATNAAAKPPASHPHETPRFRIFVIDTGWNSVARKVLLENFALIRDLNKDDAAYLLDRDMSVALLRRYRKLIGRDPIIVVHDILALDSHDPSRVRGFRLHLGLLRTPDQVLSTLQTFARFLATHRASANLEHDIRKGLRREGLAGAIEIVMSGSAHSDVVGM